MWTPERGRMSTFVIKDSERLFCVVRKQHFQQVEKSRVFVTTMKRDEEGHRRRVQKRVHP